MMTPTQTPKHDIAALEGLYTEAEQADQEVFAEMRSSLLLIAGEHYTKKSSQFYKRVRESKDLNDQQKIRLTKNHTQAITKIYANNIVSLLPGVAFEPKNPSEIQDQKAAELHSSVWTDISERNNLDERKDEWCDDMLGTGEMATKIFWDPTLGKIKAFHQKVGEDGQPLVDEMGQMVPDHAKPVYEGGMSFEEVYGFNLLRAPECKDLKKSPYLIIRKMAKKSELTAKFPDKEKMIKESADGTFNVFDPGRGGYQKNSKTEILVKEYYFRPCLEFPKGWFYIATTDGILAEGELPGGIFPIVWGYFDKLATTPRGRGPVKIMRPYQAEINRSASKMAEHQITLGDDKLLIQNGTKISAGIALPGVRSVNYTGMEPGILAGRDGSQYLAYMQSQIEELYRVMNVQYALEEAAPGQVDPVALLHRSASQKMKFQRYIKRFERFLIEVAKVAMSLAKIHMPDDAVIYAVGKKEQVNISEFKNANDICYEVTMKPQSEDAESKLGRQLMLTNVLQYVGGSLDKESIGKIIKAMPYANADEAFDDLTMEYEAAKNDILALDRGELPPVHEYDDHVYVTKRLVSRKRQADFKFLAPEIQNNYATVIQQHQLAEVERQKKILAAKAEYIPTDGMMVRCDMYVADPKDPSKQKTVKLPYSSLSWLTKMLEAQGQSLEELEKMNQGALAEMSDMLIQQQGAPNGMGPQMGAGMPGGVENVVRNGIQQQPQQRRWLGH